MPRNVRSSGRTRTRAKPTLPLDRSPRLFISHDTRDQSLGDALADLVRGATGGALKTFRSSDAHAGIEFGREWFPTILAELQRATDVVVLLTPHSFNRAWLMFEAGVARGMGKEHIFGVTIRLGVEQANSGPLYHFMNCSDDEESLTGLVTQLIRRNLGGEPLESAVKAQVREFRSKIDAWALQADLPPLPAGEASAARLLEEVKLIARDLHKDGNARLLGPTLFEQFPLYPAGGGGYDCTGWLLLIAVLRDELPWFFELGLELHRALSDGEPMRIAGAKARLLSSLRQVARNDWLQSVLADSNRELIFRLSHLPDMVESYLREIEPPSKPGAEGPSRRAVRRAAAGRSRRGV